MKKVGLQLYSIKEYTAEDFYGSLKKVGAIGYDTVEFAGYGDTDAKTMKKWLEDCGLQAVSTHTGGMFGNLDFELEYLNELGVKNMILPAYELKNKEDVLHLAEQLEKIGEVCNQSGISLGYHNHSFEFEKDGGDYLLDILFENTSPENLKVQLDVCWAQVAGVDPVSYLKKYKDRCKTVHMKEVETVSPYKGTAVGMGIVDFKGIYELFGDSIEYIVEQEGIEMDCWEGLKKSVDYLKAL